MDGSSSTGLGSKQGRDEDFTSQEQPRRPKRRWGPAESQASEHIAPEAPSSTSSADGDFEIDSDFKGDVVEDLGSESEKESRSGPYTIRPAYVSPYDAFNCGGGSTTLTRSTHSGHTWENLPRQLQEDEFSEAGGPVGGTEGFRRGPRPGEGHVGWTRGNHPDPPAGWDSPNISLAGHRPARLTHDTRAPEPNPIPFHELARGIMRFPEGNDAADMTQAVQFTLKAKKDYGKTYKFPTDLHRILSQIRLPRLTNAHTDSEVQRRYERWLKEANSSARRQRGEQNQQGSAQVQTRLGGRMQSQACGLSQHDEDILASHLWASAGSEPSPDSLIRDGPQPLGFNISERAQVIRAAKSEAGRHQDYTWNIDYHSLVDYVASQRIADLNQALSRDAAPTIFGAAPELLRDVSPKEYTSTELRAIINFARSEHQQVIEWRNTGSHLERSRRVALDQPRFGLAHLVTLIETQPRDLLPEFNRLNAEDNLAVSEEQSASATSAYGALSTPAAARSGFVSSNSYPARIFGYQQPPSRSEHHQELGTDLVATEQLLRDLAAPPSDNQGDFARSVRFAQSEAQRNVPWTNSIEGLNQLNPTTAQHVARREIRQAIT
ncbi:hypothetical protein K469DRAFT_685345 [Zopfia rhizophila CBS 207.26]|uniref:Uncharacterized protein n=1 Tax=Zopfia rhizophila CBS 207.26 TaxID=1314779 RepID=A0A6A6E889_9PEZI|nr:hypothetical protein K469DRAFT_685345 [Zopfia rhizophila CBS 207.26]